MTSKVMFHLLSQKKVYFGAERTFRRMVRKIREKRANLKKGSFLELDFEFGEYLQVDHGPVRISLKGEELDGYLFVATVPGATLRYCQFYPNKSQEFWGKFHDNMFSFFGGVFSTVIYDNDSVLKNNKANTPTGFCLDLQRHYQFKAKFCNKASGWEKGSVENGVGYCRRNFLYGVQNFESVENINEYLESKCLREKGALEVAPMGKTKKELGVELTQKLGEFSFTPKTWSVWRDLKVNTQQCILFKGHKYSVPERYLGILARVLISSSEVKIYHGHDLISTHQRKFLEGESSLKLEHYIEQLKAKPSAFDFAKVVQISPLKKDLLSLKRRLIELNGKKEGYDQLIKILSLKRRSPQEFSMALETALDINSISYSAFYSLLYNLQLKKINYPKMKNASMDGGFQLSKYGKLEKKGNRHDRTNVTGIENARCT
jgi:hypothetical protein